MNPLLHIHSGDCAADTMRRGGIEGDVLVWHDILYEGPRPRITPHDGPAFEAFLAQRAAYLVEQTGGGIAFDSLVSGLRRQYAVLDDCGTRDEVVLWFDACLFDQSILAHVLARLAKANPPPRSLRMICIGAFEGIEPFHGLGQLQPGHLAGLFPARRDVTPEEISCAISADAVFAVRDPEALASLAGETGLPLPFVPAAAQRLLEEMPNPETGLGKLACIALEAVRSGLSTPSDIFHYAQTHDTHPCFWGDTMLWARLNALARQTPQLVIVEGPEPFLPQWESLYPLSSWRVRPAS